MNSLGHHFPCYPQPQAQCTPATDYSMFSMKEPTGVQSPGWAYAGSGGTNPSSPLVSGSNSLDEWQNTYVPPTIPGVSSSTQTSPASYGYGQRLPPLSTTPDMATGAVYCTQNSSQSPLTSSSVSLGHSPSPTAASAHGAQNTANSRQNNRAPCDWMTKQACQSLPAAGTSSALCLLSRSHGLTYHYLKREDK